MVNMGMDYLILFKLRNYWQIQFSAINTHRVMHSRYGKLGYLSVSYVSEICLDLRGYIEEISLLSIASFNIYVTRYFRL